MRGAFGIREFLFHGDTFYDEQAVARRAVRPDHRLGPQDPLGLQQPASTRSTTARGKDESRRLLGRRLRVGPAARRHDSIKKRQKSSARVRGRENLPPQRAALQAFFVIGTPLETRATLDETLRYARRLDPDFFDFNIAYQLPGTELFEIVEREGLFEKAPSEAGYGSAAIRTRELSSADLTAWRRRALLTMYLRPRYIARTLLRAGSPRVALNYLKAGVRRFRQLTAP